MAAGRFVTTVTGVTVACFLAGKLGLWLAVVNVSTSAVWPPAGIGVAALLVFGLRVWPALAVAAFLVTFDSSRQVTPSIAIAAGNTLESVAAAFLVTRYARGIHAFERGTDILRFTLLGALVSPIIAATIATAALRLGGLAPAADAGLIWLTRWIGDAVGMMIFAPACILLWVPPPPARGGRYEYLALIASAVAILSVVFGTTAEIVLDSPLAVGMVPLLLWGAFRFDPRTTSLLSVVLWVISIYRVLNHLGPFSLGAPKASLLIAQTLVAILATLFLSVAAEVAIRRRVEREMRALADTLERRVIDRTAELTRVHDRLVEAQAVAHVGSWQWDVATDALWWSDELCRIFGVDKAPSSFDRYLTHVHPDDRNRIYSEIRQSASARQAFSFEHRIVTPGGDVRVLHTRGRPEFNDEGRLIRMIGVGHDITERTRAENERAKLRDEQAARREAEEANRAKDAFLATLSHELRTPLNAALGWTQILRDSLPPSGRSTRAAQTIYRNLLIQSHLVSDILDVSRIAKQGLSIERQAVNLRGVVEAAIDMVRETATVRRVRIEIEAGPGGVVIGDAQRLQQVVWNLLSNAVKFASEGGRVLVSIVARPHDVELSVVDDGPGIAPEFLPYVFEQFRQADASVTREHGGLGLGLAIAQHIVELHRGTIEVTNGSNGGAIFTIRLPRTALPGTEAAVVDRPSLV